MTSDLSPSTRHNPQLHIMRDMDNKAEKRNRPPRSCDPCRLRKMKCNRALPCDTCNRRGKGSSCQYAANADRNGPRETNNDNVRERLKNLESLVISLTQEGVRPDATLAISVTPSAVKCRPTELETETLIGVNSPSATTAEPATTKAQPVLTRPYVDPSHWSSILEDIRQIRDQLSSPNNAHEQAVGHPESSTNASEPESNPREESQADRDIVFGPWGALDLDLQLILGNLPSRQLCDRLVSHYFRARHAILPIIHPVKFQREYASFWEAPGSTPPLWIGLLFALLSLSATMLGLSGSNEAHGPENMENIMPSAKSMSRSTERCLVLGNYATAGEYCLEVLLIHLQSCFLRSKDSDMNLWFLMGIIIRIALKLGYHRDPAKLPTPKLSPFEGEMRRRVWVTISQIDTLMSFHIGLPSMIPAEYCDTELPRNLENSDFGPETPVLPQSRPVSDYTPVLYTISKSSVMTMFRAVVRHTQSLGTSPYDETVALDRELRTAYSNTPTVLQYMPINQSIVDSPTIIMDRTTIEMLHLKSIIVLHRQYITACRQDPLFNFSRTACLQAAETALRRQVELHEATQPGCQLYDQRWMLSPLTTNDFILAAMIVCLELTIRTHWPGSFVTEDAEFARYFGALQGCQSILMAASEFSTEAHIASGAIDSTIRRILDYAPLNGSAAGPIHPSVQHQPKLSMENYGTPYIDWAILDNQLQEPFAEDLDLDSWIIEAVEASGPFDLS